MTKIGRIMDALPLVEGNTLVRRKGTKTSVRGNSMSMRRVTSYFFRTGAGSELHLTSNVFDALKRRNIAHIEEEEDGDLLSDFVRAVRDGDDDTIEAIAEKSRA